MAATMFVAYFNYFNVWWVIIWMSLAQFGYGITYSCSTAMYADTVVYNEWKNRTNAAGWINGLQLFPLKIGFMARSIIIPFVLAIQASSAYNAGDIAGGDAKASSAKTALLVILIVGIVIYIGLFGLGMCSAALD